MADLASRKCVPCKKGTPALAEAAAKTLLAQLPAGWKIAEGKRIEKEFKFPDFKSALAFTNEVGKIAEKEAHHPDVHLAWGKVKLVIWTHSVDGLSENDFVLAAKVEEGDGR